MAIRIRLPKNQTEIIKEAHPATVSPWNHAYNVYPIAIRLQIRNKKPNEAMTRKGRTEKEVMPSMAKLNILCNEYLELPPLRPFRS